MQQFLAVATRMAKEIAGLLAIRNANDAQGLIDTFAAVAAKEVSTLLLRMIRLQFQHQVHQYGL